MRGGNGKQQLDGVLNSENNKISPWSNNLALLSIKLHKAHAIPLVISLANYQPVGE